MRSSGSRHPELADLDLPEPAAASPASAAGPAEAEAACAALEAVLHARAPHLHLSAGLLRSCARGVAAELGLSEESQAELDWAVRVRDIGMIWLPEELLSGKRSLAAEDWELVNRHPVLGAEILDATPALTAISPAVRFHHERWDGEGYPDGLRGRQAPQTSRIIAVCDAFVAMASDRPHRRGLGFETASEQVREGRGSQFDPEAADALAVVIQPRSQPARGREAKRRTTAVGRRGSSDLAKAVERFEAIPALAPAHERLCALCEDEPRPGRLVPAVEDDVGLTVAVLRAAQRADGPGRGVTNVPDAIGRLGGSGVMSAVRDLPVSDFSWRSSREDVTLHRFRVHAVTVARAASRLGEEAERKDHEDLVAAALLHDVGKLVLMHAGGARLADDERPGSTPEDRVRHEQRELGLDHATLGALLARRWDLPDRLATAIAEHHSAEGDGPAAFVRLADMLAHHAQGAPVERNSMLRLGYDCSLHPRTLRTVVFDLPHTGGSQRGRAEPSPLTSQQTRMLRGLADGKVYKQIARETGLSTSTVRTHLHNAYQRLGAPDRAHAVIRATEQGWI